MNKTKKRSFTALLVSLAMMLVLVLSLGLFCACGGSGNETASTWHYGTSAPENDLGKNGDRYFDTESLTAYVMQNGEWVPVGLYRGSGAPDTGSGTDGDLYLDTANGVLYENSNGEWSIVLKLKGDPGRSGVMWFSGDKDPEAGDPAIKDAQEGDFYLNKKTFEVFQLNAAGTWDSLGSIRGDDGAPAKDPVQFFDGKGAPSEEITKQAKDGDLYLGKFDGLDKETAGYRLYRYNGEKGDWDVLMENMEKEGVVNIYSYADLVKFRDGLNSGSAAGYESKEVHLKADIDFQEAATVSIRRTVSTIDTAVWSPIGTQANPFKGTFNGEGHKIENFSAKTTDSATPAGFFGYVESATIEHLHFVGASVEASGSGVVGAVVVGQTKGEVRFRDVVVESSDVTATESAKVGGLVGKVEEGTVTVEEVDVSTGKDLSGGEKQSLVGEGGEDSVTLSGSNTVGNELASGFVEKHHMNGEVVESTTYEISTAEGLAAFRDSVNGAGKFADKADTYENKTVKLMSDIDLENEEWKPIGGTKWSGQACTNPFKGTFDGQGYTIKDLSLARCIGADTVVKGSVRKYYGLFGAVSGATIENFTIENVATDKYVSTRGHNPNKGAMVASFAGPVIGVAYDSIISNINVQGKIEMVGNQYIGGIVGRIETPSTVENCVVDGGDKETSYIWATEMYVGGIVGHAADGNNSTFKGNVVKNILIANDFYLVAHQDVMPGYGDNYALQGGIGGIAGIVGLNSTIENNEVTNVVIQTNWISNNTQNYYERIGVISGSYSTGASTFIGNTAMNVTVNTVNGVLFNGGVVGDKFGNLSDVTADLPVLNNNTIDITWRGVGHYYKDGETTQNYWYIENADMLTAFATMVNGNANYPVPELVYGAGTTKPVEALDFASEDVKLMGDIDLSKIANWTPIGTQANPFKGTFDGAKTTAEDGKVTDVYTISNLTINTTTGYVGLFGVTGDVTLKNVAIDGATVTLQGDTILYYIGVLVGRHGSSGGSISNVKVYGAEVTGTATGQYIGAIAGWTYGPISDCYADLKVSAKGSNGYNAQVGGIVGQTYGNISRCYAKVDLYGNNIGGIVGYFHQKINGTPITLSDCYATGKIDAVEYITEKRGNICPIYSGGVLGCTCSPLVRIVNNFFDGTLSEFAHPLIGASAGDDNNADEELTSGVFEGNSWSEGLPATQHVQGYQGKIQIGSLARDEGCTFTAGMSYEAFLNSLAG